MSDAVFITWGRNNPRAQDFAAAFQSPLTLWEINVRLSRAPVLAPLRYQALASATWRRLNAEKPGAIVVQSPPLFAGLVVARYARRSGARWIVDLHSSPFNTRRWGWSLPLQRRLAQHATATLVHGEYLLARTRGWKGRVLNADEPPPAFRLSTTPKRDNGFRIQVVCSFSFDEPISLVLQAARQVPEVAFHITGDFARASPALLTKPPPNVTFTGFLARPDYFRELTCAHAVMVLTTRADAMQKGAGEAMYLEQPLILSDQPALRGYYSGGAIFVPNTIEGIVKGVRRMMVEEAVKRGEIHALACQKQEAWGRIRAELEELLGLPHPNLSPEK